MTLSSGQKLGPYEIIEPAGAGGMGEVYKAKDTRLDRTVALKILPEEVAGTPEFKERFDREARSISSLNHAHICTLHDVGHEDGINYLVMEFLKGETLADRLKRGPIPYEEMLQISIQIASGLDSAHQQGVIHRDLKPGNIMLTEEGAKLLDFGLARSQLDGTGDGVTAITQTTPLTGPNRIVGTMQYMSPEQLEGKVADARSDIFAFGAIMYEMSTGKRAFEGSSSATLIAAIIERDPVPISVIMPTTPPLFERLVKKCLAKDPRKRWQSASDLSDELRWISEAGSQVGLPAHIAARRKFKFGLARVVGAIAILSTLVLAYFLYDEKSKPPPEQTVRRYTINIGQGLTNIYWPRLSPDGGSVAFVAYDTTNKARRIWVRPINSLEAYPLLNSGGAGRFIWSPDGQHIAFFDGDQLKRISISGGQSQLVCQGPTGSDGSWSTSDLIIFDGRTGDTMKIVAAGGGIPRPASLVDTAAGETNYAWPWFLPDGKHFIFRSEMRHGDGQAGPVNRIKLGSVDNTTSVTLLDLYDTVDRLEYSDAGYILFVMHDNLMGLPFDAEKLEVTGEPKPIAMKIGMAGNTYAFSVSSDGTLLYQTNNQSSQQDILLMDRTGKVIDTVGVPGRYSDVAFSPDETRIAYSSRADATDESDIWIYDLRRKVPTRLTFDSSWDAHPVWSPDGSQVYFSSPRNGLSPGIYRKNANGLGEVELVYAAEGNQASPNDISPDGTKLLFTESSNNWDIGLLHFDDSNRVEMLTNSSFFESMASFSADDEFITYMSDESGRHDVYVRRLDGAGGKWQISTKHAHLSRWNGNGTELYYPGTDGTFYAVKISTDGEFKAENPEELFESSLDFFSWPNTAYDVSADGQRFVLISRRSGARSDSGDIVVVENWAQEFRDKK